jgi:hypothetical protein
MNHEHDAVIRNLTLQLGNRQLASRVRDSLIKLRDGVGGEQLAEMARDLLDGRIDLRAVSQSSAYAQPLSGAMHGYTEWFNSLNPSERQKVMEDARAELSRIEAEDAGRTQPD